MRGSAERWPQPGDRAHGMHGARRDHHDDRAPELDGAGRLRPWSDEGDMSMNAHDCALARLAGGPGLLLVVVAHPDDETIGMGATLGALVELSWTVAIVHVTDGAPRNAELRASLSEVPRLQAASTRRSEVRRALDTGHVIAATTTLGVPDQEAPRAIVRVAQRLAALVDRLRPDVVVSHAYEGGHPDNDAVAVAVRAALSLSRPALQAEMTAYHAADGKLTTGRFLPAPADGCSRTWAGKLASTACLRRRAMLDAFESQRSAVALFGDEAEPLRCAPRYDFLAPPHAGRLHYETMPFGWTGAAFRAEASDALHHLELDADGRRPPPIA